jgi:hypothetical protein
VARRRPGVQIFGEDPRMERRGERLRLSILRSDYYTGFATHAS